MKASTPSSSPRSLIPASMALNHGMPPILDDDTDLARILRRRAIGTRKRKRRRQGGGKNFP